jgi:hypothetical protein
MPDGHRPARPFPAPLERDLDGQKLPVELPVAVNGTCELPAIGFGVRGVGV